MGKTIFIPKMGANIDIVKIGFVKVKVGQEVKKGDVLFDIVTQKATFEIEAESSGVILHLDCNEGDTNYVLDEVGYIGKKGEKIPPLVKNFDISAKSEYASDVEIPKAQKSADALIKATPGARLLAKQKNIPLSKLAMLGKPIIKRSDVEDLISNLKFDEPIKPVKVSEIKLAEIKNLEWNKQCILSSVVHRLCADKLRAQITDICKKERFRLNVGQYITFKVAKLVEKFKELNAYFKDDRIHYYEKINLGIAMHDEKNLFVPVIRDANRLTLKEYSKAYSQLMMKVAAGTLKPEDLLGGTMTTTDLSSKNVYMFSPVINKYQSAIFGLSSEFSESGTNSYINLILSFDHRVLDGLYAATFLTELGHELA